jgi:hypothetical protein
LVHEDDDIAFEGVEMAMLSTSNGVIVNTHRWGRWEMRFIDLEKPLFGPKTMQHHWLNRI